MKKVFFNCLKSFVGGGVLLGLSLILFSCGENTGLGGAVDTEAPTVNIQYPPASSAIRGTFLLYGTWDDDKSVTKIVATIENTTTGKKDYEPNEIKISLDKTWSLEVNNYDSSNSEYTNGWQLPDGKYQISLVGYDAAGHTSGKASRSFEIDNTAPVVVLSSPGSTTSATEYGSSFYVEGTIADEHSISSLGVTVYDEDGTTVLSDTDTTPWYEEDVATAGGTNVSLMKFSTGSTTLQNRYASIYGTDRDAGTKNYYCTIYVSDNAKEYTNPAEETNSASGNSTSIFYLYSDVYKTLMSSVSGYGLSAADLMTIVNGTYIASDASDEVSRAALSNGASQGTLTSEQLSAVKAILAKNGDSGYDSEKSKATDTSEKHLKFSLNPKVNPTYTISGMSIENSSYPSGTKGQTVTFILSPGLDGTSIEVATVKAYLLKCNDTGSTFSSDDYAEFISDPENYESDNKILLSDLSEKYDEDTMLSSLTSTFKLPEIVANYYYIIAFSGQDADGYELVPDGLYGFIGTLSGTPPVVNISSPISQAIIGSSADITFKGTFVTTEVELENASITFDVSDVESGETLGTIKASGSGKAGDSVTWSEPEYNSETSKYTYSWTCNLSDCEGYATYSAEAGSGRIYSYTATVNASDASGNQSTASRIVTADTVAPKITINSVTPTVTDYTDSSHTDSSAVYANGTITISGSIEEMNLKSASYTVYVGGKAEENLTDVSISSTQFKILLDTTALSDDSSLKVVITAEDRANSGL